MSFYVSRTDRRNETNNTLVLRRPKLAHISVLLKSNSGAIPLANKSYKIFLRSGQTLEGTTDEDGLVEHRNVPPGDHQMEIDGFSERVLVPTLPNHIVRRPLRVPGLFLFEEDQEDTEEDMTVSESEASHFPLQEDQEGADEDESGWEDVAVYDEEDEQDAS